MSRAVVRHLEIALSTTERHIASTEDNLGRLNEAAKDALQELERYREEAEEIRAAIASLSVDK